MPLQPAYISDVDLQLPLRPASAYEIDRDDIFTAFQEIARSSYGRALKTDFGISFTSFLREQSVGRVYLQATEAMAKGDFVNIFTSGGVAKIQKASSADTTKPAHGFVSSDVAVALNDFAEVTPGIGLNLQKTGLTKGAAYYLSTAGAISTAVGAVNQFVGIALSDTILLVCLAPPGLAPTTIEGFSARKTADQTGTSPDGSQKVVFQDETGVNYDTNAIHDPTNSIATIKTAGKYTVMASVVVSVQGSGTTNGVTINLVHNNATIIATDTLLMADGDVRTLKVHAQPNLAVNDTLWVIGAGTLWSPNVTVKGVHATRFSAQRIGA